MIKLKEKTKKFLLCMFFVALSCNVFAEKKVNYNRLITAIGTVESKMNDKAINGIYAGFLQISPTIVKDCNRINKINGNPKRYSLQDRYNRKKSIEMFHIIQNFYNKHRDLGEKDRIGHMIRLWNGGPGWVKNPRKTDGYYKKVIKVYNDLKNKGY